MTTESQTKRSAALTVADSLQTIKDLTRDMMADPNLGIWSFEMDDGKPPRMYGNKAMDALLGCDGAALTPEEYYHAWYDHIDPDHYEPVHTTVEKMIAGHSAEVQYPFLHPTRGRMMVRCGGHRDMSYKPGLRIIGRHQDVSELLHFERKTLEALAAERDRAVAVEQAQTLFFSTVSHDIRTPLNAIVGFAELLDDGGVTDEAERREYVKTIRASSKMLARLIDDVLDLSKLQSGKLAVVKEPTDVPQLIREVVASFEIVRARKSIVLRPEVDEMPRLMTDPHRLRQILFNLLSNAFKYTAEGEIALRATWREGTLTLTVRDTGCGIPTDEQSRIMEPFVQVADRNHRDGTGLGLPICTNLAKLLGGELTLESTPGKGSTFTVTLRGLEKVEGGRLKVEQRNDPSIVPPPTSNLQPHSPHRHILIVDDSPVNLAVLKAMIARCGVTDIRTAANGREALAVLAEHPDIDLVFTDYWMPELDGVGLVRAMRANGKGGRHVTVCLVTADVDAKRSHETGDFDEIILKPVSTEDLARIIGG